MKLVIGGATGFVGREVLRQALQCAEITEIVTIGRRPVVVDDEQRSKITDIVMEAQDAFPDSVGRLIADSDACIWTIGVTLTKSKRTPEEEFRMVTRDYTLAAIDALARVNGTGRPLRFVYVSAASISRDLDRDWEELAALVSPVVLKLRCVLEVELVEYAAKSGGEVEVCCVRPGYIIGDRGVPGYTMPNYGIMDIPTVRREDAVAVMLKQCVEGIEMDPISNDELNRIGEKAVMIYG